MLFSLTENYISSLDIDALSNIDFIGNEMISSYSIHNIQSVASATSTLFTSLYVYLWCGQYNPCLQRQLQVGFLLSSIK